MNKNKSNFFNVCICLIIGILLAGAIAFIFYFTNNLSTDLTTFYIQYGAQEIRRDTSKMKFETGVFYRFDVCYPLGFPSNESGQRYKASIEINEAGREIQYTVNTYPVVLYPESPDVSKSFEIVQYDNYFTFRIPEETTFESILLKAYEGEEVKDIPNVDLTAKDYFDLVVKSYDENTVIRIGFGFFEKSTVSKV